MRLGRAAEKSGARNGFAICRETTDCGTTAGLAGAAVGSSTGSGASSASVSMPALRSMSRLSDRASSVTTASSDEQRQERRVADGGLRQGGRDVVETLELLGAS